MFHGQKEKAAVYSKTVNFLLLIAGIIFITYMLTIKTQDLSFDNNAIYEWQGEGEIRYGDKTEAVTGLPFNTAGNQGDVITFSTILKQEDGISNAFMFRSVHQKVKVYLDGKPVLDYGYNNQVLHGKTPGSLWQIIRLPESFDGMELKIELETVYAYYGMTMPAIYIGTKSDMVFMVFKQAFGAICVGVPIFIVGMALLVIGILFRKNKNTRRKLCYLGGLAVLASIWMLLEARAMQLFTGKTLLYTQLLFIVFSLIPVVLNRFLLTYQRFAESRYMRFVFYLSAINFAVVQLLQITDTKDYLETTYGTHAMFILMMFGIIGISIKDIKEKRPGDNSIFIACIVFGFFGLIDIFRFYMMVWSSDALVCTRIGMAGFIVILGVSAIRQIAEDHGKSIEEKTFKKLAYTDMMTGMPNRTAFEAHMEQIREAGASVLVAVIDINKLKYINDTYGHKSGDEAICHVGRTFTEFLRDKAYIYRIGGDEFCVLTEQMEEKDMEIKCRQMKEKLSQIRETVPYPLMAACGYKKSDASGIDQTFIEADRRMYADKIKEEINGKTS